MSYEYWVHQQLEPTDVIITGTYRRYDRVHTVKQMKPMVQLTEAEDNKIQDAYLESKGIDINPKSNETQ